MAPTKKMKNVAKKLCNEETYNLSLDDALCPICLSIMIEPVTMPCKHSLCSDCFQSNVQQTALTCPMCRKRISVWVRKTEKEGKLVNQKLWNHIQEKFSEQVEAHFQGREDVSISNLLIPKSPLVSTPGEIRKEYEAQMARQEAERLAKEKAESEQSAEIIYKIQIEEKKKMELEQMCAKDFEIAKSLRKQQMDERIAQHRKPKKILDFSPIVCSQKGPMYSYLESTPKSSQHRTLGSPSTPKTSQHARLSNPSTVEDSEVVQDAETRRLRDITSSQNSESDVDEFILKPMSPTIGSKNKENCLYNTTNSSDLHNCEQLKNSYAKEKISYACESSMDNSAIALRLSTSNEMFNSTTESFKHSKLASEAASNRLPPVSPVATTSAEAKIIENLSDVDPDSEEWKVIIDEQKFLEKKLEQEKEDRKLALQLSRDEKRINRQKGTEGEYSLRNSLNTKSLPKTPKTSKSRKRARSPNQSTIMESFAKRQKRDSN